MLNESDCHHFPQNATIFTQSYYQRDGSYHFMWKMLLNKIFKIGMVNLKIGQVSLVILLFNS
jgi:hypothetical protein